MSLQAKLLRAVEYGEVQRVGALDTRNADVCVIAATNRDLLSEVADGRFRSDLYYRLNVFPVVLPPLRERREDIPMLTRHFTQRFARRMGRRIEAIPAAVMDALVRYPWPGNVREMQNIIERAVILSPGPALQIPPGDLKPGAAPAEAPAGAAVTLADAEREQILRALRDAHWVVGGPNGAAARLGVKRSNLQWKMKKLGISRPK
jgi:formate hydrogenlyase transcriptional activator